jgi:hypothetical protein
VKQSECYSWEPEVEEGIKKLPESLQIRMREVLNQLDFYYGETGDANFVCLGEEIAAALIVFGKEYDG